MLNIFIDESGSITNTHPEQKYFVITLLKVNDMKNLGKVYKRFVTSRMGKLKTSDINGKMFKGGKFKELKGCCFSRELKLDFVDFFTKNNYFEIFWILVENKKLSDKFCKNTARSFNYVMCHAMEFFIRQELLQDNNFLLHIDERNERTKAKYFLEDYLNTQISLTSTEDYEFNVKYYDSEENIFIQIADVFSNLYFSNCMTDNSYSEKIDYLQENGYVKYIFKFPLH